MKKQQIILELNIEELDQLYNSNEVMINELSAHIKDLKLDGNGFDMDDIADREITNSKLNSLINVNKQLEKYL